ncbi:hypothetical protein LSCM1_01121 [Leishmania martiniquensis]|uniref:tRNA N(3)-methylcytidine methyltransferase n=1 Tax=Leishmania martiniquensis TaxID=1580590 RepID=A0A836KIJ8_9TRYP|nr:hypothetical protein LSCM1_01121 [Leishmania martiniquensis]
MNAPTAAEEPAQLSQASSSSCLHDASNGHKRARSPPPLHPPFVPDYRPYSGGQLQPRRVNRHTDMHKREWDLYYRNNTVNGYRDRHYILREFHELRAAIDAAAASEEQAGTPDEVSPSTSNASVSPACSFSWMEAGCGVGNAMLPVFAQYGHLRHWRALLGFDISSVAISLLEEKVALLPPALAAKVHVCVWNPSESEVTDCPFFTPEGTSAAASSTPSTGAAEMDRPTVVDRAPVCGLPEFVSLIFVLCSIPVSTHAIVISRLARCMARPGGVLYFRDYAVSDHAERRFQSSLHRRRGDWDNGTGGTNTYERTNGTLSHFFSLEEVRSLFEGAGFEVITLDIIANEVTNRKTSVSFARRFVQGRFRLRARSSTEEVSGGRKLGR